MKSTIFYFFFVKSQPLKMLDRLTYKITNRHFSAVSFVRSLYKYNNDKKHVKKKDVRIRSNFAALI